MIDHPAWIALQAHVTKNLPEYITFVTALAIASVCTMPEKCPLIIGPVDSPWKQAVQDAWAWFRNALQTAVPAARANHAPTVPPPSPLPAPSVPLVVPSQPVGPANLKVSE